MGVNIGPADALAVQHLLLAYASANDERDVDAILDCFTPDGTFGMQVAGSDVVGPFGRGSDPDLRTFLDGMLGAQRDRRRHVLTNVRFLEAEPDRCVVGSYLTLVVTDGAGTRTLTSGAYRDVVLRGPQGWRLAHKWLDLDGAP